MDIDYGIIGAISNPIRGGQWRKWFGVEEVDEATGKFKKLNWVSSDGLNALIYGICILVAVHNVWFALLSAALMWVGAKAGWGDYIGALGGWRFAGLKENIIIDFFIRSLKKYPKWWGFAGLTIRGAFWGLCLSASYWWCHQYDIALEFIARGSLMGVAYWAALAWSKNRINDTQGKCGWGLGEIFFGWILWSALN